MPAPDSFSTGGEDACFVNDNGLVMGIADGVGGWVRDTLTRHFPELKLGSPPPLKYSDDHPGVLTAVCLLPLYPGGVRDRLRGVLPLADAELRRGGIKRDHNDAGEPLENTPECLLENHRHW